VRIKTGTYVLILELISPARLVVGKLGGFDFPTGWDAYAGSACGPGGCPPESDTIWVSQPDPTGIWIT